MADENGNSQNPRARRTASGKARGERLDTARTILRTLVTELKLRGGQGALLWAVIQSAYLEGVDREDFDAGLHDAIAQGWVVIDLNNELVSLTDAGFAAAH